MKKRVFAFGVALVFLLSFILPNSNVAYATETNTSIEESVNKTGDILTNELDNTITDVEETELSSEEITIESNTLEDQGKVENKNDSNVMVQPMTTVEEPTDPVEPTDSVEPADPVEPIPVIIEGYVKANLFVRPAKGSTESLGIISRGTKVSGTEDGNWLKFTFNGSEAYIAKSFIVDEWVEETLAGYISATIVVRPSIGSSSRLGLIEAGTKVSGIVKGAWLEIQYNGRTAYIAKSFVTDQNPSIDGIMSSNLVVRPAKNSNQSLGIIKFRTPVSGVIDGSWVRFNYNGKTAFIARSFVVEANREDKGYLTSSIYVRPSAGSSSNIGIISKGSFVEGVTYGDWLKISFNGKFGYIAKSFLTDKVVTETRYATAGVNIRSSKVNGKILSVAKMGDTFTGFLDGSWFKTTYNGQTAYISAKYLTTNYVPKINYTGYAKFQVFYRWSPSKDAVTSGLIKKGEKIQGKLSNGWIEFYRNGRTYYTLAENFTQQKAIKSDWTVINGVFRLYDSNGRLTGYRKVGNRHILVDIYKQRLYYFNNGKLVVNTGVVTGQPSKGWSTPIGHFNVERKGYRVPMSGDGWAMTPEYAIFFRNGMFALHDAWYRTSAHYSNPKTYLTYGSHGCVNTPLGALRTVYNSIQVGDPITVFKTVRDHEL